MFLDTANLSDIQSAIQTGIIEGITTNPTILSKETQQAYKHLLKINQIFKGRIFFQISGKNFEEYITDFKKIYDFGQKHHLLLGYKIPIDTLGLTVLSYLNHHYPNEIYLATTIYTLDQAILAVQAGCDYLAPYINRMENQNINTKDFLIQLSSYIKEHHYKTKIMCASFKNTQQITQALTHGSHTATISFPLLISMLEKSFVTKDIETFYIDAKKAKGELE